MVFSVQRNLYTGHYKIKNPYAKLVLKSYIIIVFSTQLLKGNIFIVYVRQLLHAYESDYSYNCFPQPPSIKRTVFIRWKRPSSCHRIFIRME